MYNNVYMEIFLFTGTLYIDKIIYQASVAENVEQGKTKKRL